MGVVDGMTNIPRRCALALEGAVHAAVYFAWFSYGRFGDWLLSYCRFLSSVCTPSRPYWCPLLIFLARLTLVSLFVYV